MKITILITISLFLVSNLQAELRLINYTSLGISGVSTLPGTIGSPGTIGTPSLPTCFGFIETETTGTAGPFQLQLFALNAAEPFTNIDGLDGIHTTGDICEQDFDVYVVNRFGCSSFLGSVRNGVLSNFTENGVLTQLVDQDDAVSANKIVGELDNFSDQINVRPSQNQIFMVYPNPFSTSVSIGGDLTQASNYRVAIFNSIGQQVATQDHYFRKGRSEVEITSLFNQAAGIYHIKLIDISTDETFVYKMLKLR